MKTYEGTIVKTQEELELTLNTFFSYLLEEPDWDWDAVQREVMWHIPKVIMEEHNFMLLKPIDMEKFQAYVKQMVNEKGILVIFLKLLM